jgi:F-type H+-transporting ATPase subunit epsilon
MKLRIATPLDVVVEEDGILAVQAEDASGSFGILPRHADFLTSLAISVVNWESGDKGRHFCAVRGGVFRITHGQTIEIATREAVRGDNLATLDQTVLARFKTDIETERTQHAETTGLQINAIRQMVLHLQAGDRNGRSLFS